MEPLQKIVSAREVETFLRLWNRPASSDGTLAGQVYLAIRGYAAREGLNLRIRELVNPDFPLPDYFMVDARLGADSVAFVVGETVRSAWEAASFELYER